MAILRCQSPIAPGLSDDIQVDARTQFGEFDIMTDDNIQLFDQLVFDNALEENRQIFHYFDANVEVDPLYTGPFWKEEMEGLVNTAQRNQSYMKFAQRRLERGYSDDVEEDEEEEADFEELDDREVDNEDTEEAEDEDSDSEDESEAKEPPMKRRRIDEDSESDDGSDDEEMSMAH